MRIQILIVGFKGLNEYIINCIMFVYCNLCVHFGVEVNTRSVKPDVTPPEAFSSKPFGTRKRRDESKATGAIGLTAPKVTTGGG